MNRMMTEKESNRVRGFIVSAGYSIDSLSRKLGMSRASLSSKVNGRSDFTRKEMESISALLGESPADIFFAG